MAPNTLQAYRRDLARFVDWCAGRGVVEIDDIGPSDLAEFAAWLNSGAGLAAASAARAVVSVRGFHRFAAAEGWTQQDPSADLTPPALPMRLPKALGYEDIRDIPAGVLNPRDGWADKAAYDRTAQNLVSLFEKNFESFAGAVDDSVKAAAIRAAA